MIDWLNSSDDVLEARRVGYELRDAELGDEIERLRKQRDHLRRTIQTFRGEVFRAAAESERRAIAELEADDE